MPPSDAFASLNRQIPRRLDLNFADWQPLASIADGVTCGHIGEQAVLLLRQGSQLSIVGAKCSHYGAPLADGLIAGGQVICPWHHACFSLRDGSVQKAPGLAPLPRWQVTVDNGRIKAGAKLGPATEAAPPKAPASVTIVGGGAAAMGAVAELQAQGYLGPIALLSADDRPPYDRTKLSKACLAGKANIADLPLSLAFLPKPAALTTQLNKRATGLDRKGKQVVTTDGSKVPYDALLIATGAAPKGLPVPGAALPHVFTLRTARDAEQLLQAISPRSKVAIIGASFIGLEAAAALRGRGISVQVVARDDLPFAKVLGPELAQVLRHAHEHHGVVLHRGRQATAISPSHVTLDDHSRLAADVVLLAIGVAPDTQWLTAAGLEADDGLLVDGHLATNDPAIFAAGDVARYRPAAGGQRIEHWTVAEQMGRMAARNMLGKASVDQGVPFFWTEQYGYKIRYVGHAATIDHCEVFGDIEANSAVIAVTSKKAISAVITVGRDDVSVACERAMATGARQALPALVRS